MHQKECLEETIEIEEAIVGRRKDGILHVYYKDSAEINVELQARILTIFKSLAGGQNRNILFEAGEYVTVTKEARENAIKMEEHVPSLTTVVIVQNLAYKLVADFYYKFNKPKRPYKVFTNFEKGVEWLLAQ